METVRIPQDRVAVLIGSNGETKRMLERTSGAKLSVDREGLVEISAKEPYVEFKMRDVVKAIGRGFSPDDALALMRDEQYFEVINLKEMLDSDKARDRQKGRIIGEEGKMKSMLEECSGAKVRIYGNTVAFLGQLDEVTLAAAAANKLLEGKSHSFVHSFLQKGRRRLKEERIMHMWESPVETSAKRKEKGGK